MLTSLLSLYIAASLQSNLAIGLPNQPVLTNQSAINSSFVKTASSNLSKLIESDSIPIKKPQYISPIIDAKGSIVMDIKTNTILFEKNIHERMQIASITKLMTILIILEENKLDEVVKISGNTAQTTGTKMFLKPGETITIENLLYGAIIPSANDAAVALAEYNAETVEKFVEKMNKRALELGLINTHFSNPIGLDGPTNYSSPYDIAKLGSYIYHNKFMKEAAVIKELEVKSTQGEYIHQLKTTNDLLGNEYYKFKGLKTGQTDAAKLCLAAIAENEKGNEIITVVLGSPARFTETKILVDWIFRAYNWPNKWN